MALTPAIFLDKDGTVLEDIPYNVDPGQCVLRRVHRRAWLASEACNCL